MNSSRTKILIPEWRSLGRVALLPVLAALLLSSLARTGESQGAAGGSLPAAVILVRHAEKAAAPAADPPLTEAGKLRAEALAAALKGADVSVVITTEFLRTSGTAAVLASEAGITPEVVAAQGVSGANHIAATVSAIQKHAGKTVLVVGHSNTIPAIISALGGGDVGAICEWNYSNLFVFVPKAGGASLVRSTYGAPDLPAPAGARCGM